MDDSVSGSVYRVLMRIGHVELVYARKRADAERKHLNESDDVQTERFAGKMNCACDRICSAAAHSPGYRAYIIGRASSGFGGGMPR